MLPAFEPAKSGAPLVLGAASWSACATNGNRRIDAGLLGGVNAQGMIGAAQYRPEQHACALSGTLANTARLNVA
jgi:hypothetical protein